MSDTTAATKPRPVYRNIHVTDILKYRLPPAGMVSIGHRISGVMMFLLLPFVVWLFDVTLTSEVSYGQFTSAYMRACGFFRRGSSSSVTLALIWAYLHHFIAGVRHLWMDATHAVTKEFGHKSALVTLGVSGLLTLVLGFKLFF